jgi:hypothetical protein
MNALDSSADDENMRGTQIKPRCVGLSRHRE